jgi:hypothetical protein
MRPEEPRQGKTCAVCGRDCAGEIVWEWSGEGEICQDCWEKWSDKQWWEIVVKLDGLGLI